MYPIFMLTTKATGDSVPNRLDSTMPPHYTTGIPCFFCGTPTVRGGQKHHDAMMTRDHLTPRCRGGDGRDPRNKVVACWKCNADKGQLTLDEYRMVIAFRWGVLKLEHLEQIVKFAGEQDHGTGDRRD